MTDTESTRTKTLTVTTAASITVLDPLDNDRWSNNISYRQLVVSACIGIIQFWWHPYLHDLERLLPFLFLYNIFSIVIGYPMFYLELALGIVTRKGVVTCWDMAPMARGVGLSMLMVSLWTALCAGLLAAWSLSFLVHSFHSFLPWLHCAAIATPPCAARHRPLPPGSDTPAQSFFFNFVLNLKRDGIDSGMGPIVKELASYYMFCWMLIYAIAIKRIYSYSKLVLFKDVLAYFTLACCAASVFRLHGSTRMFAQAQWSVLYTDIQIWREAIEYALLEMTVSQGTLVMLGTYCPKKQMALSRTALLAFAASKTSSMAVAFTLGGVHGALEHDYQNATGIWSGSSASMVLWADYVARIPGSQFWSVLVFFTLFTLSLSSAALLIHTIISTLTGRSVRSISWVFLVLLCFLFMVIGVITLCTRGGLYMLNFAMNWPASKPRLAISTVVSVIVTFVYGQTTFCEDVYFAVGEYPCVFLRIAWVTAPAILFATFWTATGLSSPEVFMGWMMVSTVVTPMFIVLLFYLFFKFRVRNIVHTEK